MEVLGFILNAWIQILAINEFGMVLNRSLGIYITNLPVESVHVVCVVTYPRFYTPHILSHPSCLHSPPNLILDQSSPPTVRTTVATPPSSSYTAEQCSSFLLEKIRCMPMQFCKYALFVNANVLIFSMPLDQTLPCHGQQHRKIKENVYPNPFYTTRDGMEG